jgi:ribonuclease-3
LAFCARQIGLERFILLGKGEEATGGRKRDSIISDVMEAVIGAVYLDSGIEEARNFIRRFILSDLEHKQLFYDAKTILQEEVQKENCGLLRYELIREEGPEHDKNFVVEALIGDRKAGTGTGHSKKAAEQQAAYAALLKRKKDETTF